MAQASRFAQRLLAIKGAHVAGIGAVVLGQEQDGVASGYSPSQAYLGVLDEVIIYDRALDAAEILHHYRTLSCGGR